MSYHCNYHHSHHCRMVNKTKDLNISSSLLGSKRGWEGILEPPLRHFSFSFLIVYEVIVRRSIVRTTKACNEFEQNSPLKYMTSDGIDRTNRAAHLREKLLAIGVVLAIGGGFLADAYLNGRDLSLEAQARPHKPVPAACASNHYQQK
jgi:hypothetical protein